VKFPFNQALPIDLIKRMVIFRKEELLASLDLWNSRYEVSME